MPAKTIEKLAAETEKQLRRGDIARFWEGIWHDHPEYGESSWPRIGLEVAGVNLSVVENVLDVGCGNQNFNDISLRGKNRLVVGVDISHAALKSAKEKAAILSDLLRCAPLSLHVEGDAGALPFPDNSFDVVTSFSVLSLSGQGHQKIVQEMCRVSRDYVIFEVIHKEMSCYEPGAKCIMEPVVFDEDDIRRMLAPMSLSKVDLCSLTADEFYNWGIPIYERTSVGEGGDKKVSIIAVARK